MDRRKVLTFAAFLLLLSLRACPQCLNLDIIVLGDYSGSVQGSEDYVIDAFESFTHISSEETNIRIGLILFNEESEVTIPLTKDHSILSSFNRSRKASGSTDIENAIQQGAIQLLGEQNNSRKLLILISDGDITEGGDDNQTISTAHQLAMLGIGICTVLIKNNSSRPEFMKMISSGCYVESDYENLSTELKNLDVCL